jgi:hypothetical protein
MRHRSGLPTGLPDTSCGSCAWVRGTTCGWLAAGEVPGPTIDRDERGCVHHEPIPDCAPCGACCREAFDSVPVEDHDRRTLERRGDWIRTHPDGWRDLLRVPSPTGCGTRCAALVGDGVAPFRCVLYEDRPSACSELDAGSDACLFARRRVGLTARQAGR